MSLNSRSSYADFNKSSTSLFLYKMKMMVIGPAKLNTVSSVHSGGGFDVPHCCLVLGSSKRPNLKSILPLPHCSKGGQWTEVKSRQAPVLCDSMLLSWHVQEAAWTILTYLENQTLTSQSDVHQQSSALQEQALKAPNLKVKFAWLTCPNISPLLSHASPFVCSQGLACVAHTGLELTLWPQLCDFPATASWVLGTQVWNSQQKEQHIS